ncbi:Menaquinone biosynthesis methyltransferase [Tritrichomonas foetus]|uniref:Menaquinone biosynthesis methyltransferase n=1 Tax=Tritrichomonas foetus TaxID=1144522 RepID=A0A1J4J302_9EUKA|nr:Menaquinone biosynthesis methyltransferase [Tritrichomonas foetus]|eukprot:OHS93806.1 Menaquinone biosynthesis methyltransferase [Tritrichomonas foetus]
MSRKSKFPEPTFSSDTDRLTDSEHEEEEQQEIAISRNIGYDNIQYWLKRYDNEYDDFKNPAEWEPFEWYVSWRLLKKYFFSYLSQSQKVLYIGCGTSMLGVEICSSIEGMTEVMNIDISDKAIEMIKAKVQDDLNKEKYELKCKIKWRVNDLYQMDKWCRSKYDFIIDKGTIDSFLCSNIASKNLTDLFLSISTALRPNGYFIIVSNGAEEVRTMFFDHPNYKWELVEIIKIPKPQIKETYYYVYVYKKNEK